MAVFMVNICKFNGCGSIFNSLADLIYHIEETHIDYDPAIIREKEQQQPQCLPLSYVLKFYTSSEKREIQELDIKRRILQHANNKTTLQNNSMSLIEQDDEDGMTGSEDSNESWTTTEEFSSEFILRYGSKIDSEISPNISDKPFACPVPGCKKRYKNINGIKYHSKNGHKKDGKIRKGYRCYCGKSYKTSQGLKNHSLSHHDRNAIQTTLPIARTVAIKQNINLIVSSKQSDAKALGVAKLKSFIENNKTHVPKNNFSNSTFDKILDCDLGVLTPDISPDSSPDDKKYSLDYKKTLSGTIFNAQLNLGAFQ